MSVLRKSLKTDVCIIGGGSVGMVMSHMLNKLKINHIVIEKDELISSHPKAHYISPRSIEILKNFNITSDLITSNQIKHGQYYRYCSHLLNKRWCLDLFINSCFGGATQAFLLKIFTSISLFTHQLIMLN
mgnify:CR=1 FL=1